MMDFGAYSLLPPLVAIILAIVSRKVIAPLASGVLVGAVLLSIHDDQTSWTLPGRIFVRAIWDSISSTSHLQAFAFSLLLGAMVGVLEHGGAMRMLIIDVSRRIRTRAVRKP